MSRPLRVEFPGAIWHVTARGNDRSQIFHDDEDRTDFLGILARVVGTSRWRLHAYVLMPNHYHLLVETPEPNLSRGMRQLNGIYTQRFNRRRGRCGHLLQGRFKGILVERESHLLELCRYLALNPVRAGLVRSAGDWPWSSFRATAGVVPGPPWLQTRWTIEQFGADPVKARQKFRRFVAEGRETGYSPWDRVVDQVYLGGDAFRTQVAEMGRSAAVATEVPRSQRSVFRPSLDAIVAAVCGEFRLSQEDLRDRRSGEARKALAWLARNLGDLRLSEIAGTLGVTSWAVSHLEAQAGRARLSEASFSARLDGAERRLGEGPNGPGPGVKGRARRRLPEG